MDRRRNHEPVTYSELRAILAPIFERHREVDEALGLYRRMVPLGLAELLPEILADAKTRKVLAEVGKGRRSGWLWAFAVVGVIYGGLTAAGSLTGLLFALGVIH